MWYAGIDTRNVGYGVFKALYKMLDLDKFWNWKTRGKRTKFNTDQIFRLDDCLIIFVADRGLNTSDNIYWLNGDNKADANERDGYVYGQTIRGADAEFKTWVLSDGYDTENV